MANKTDSKILGNQAEDLACVYLQQQGLQLIERNFICRSGEIDLILQDKDQRVFVEVRYRNDSRFGCSIETVTARKRLKLLRTAHYYLQKQGHESMAYRFDIVAIMAPMCISEIKWVKNAF